MTTTAYIDESGHSGTNVHDTGQPTFVYAAVWLDERQASVLANDVALLRTSHRIQLVGDLKGGKLLKSAPGRKFIRDVLKALMTNAVPISIVALHKPYMAAGVVIEDCTDYVYNDSFDERWTWDAQLREPIIDKISRASDPGPLLRLWEIREGNDGAAFTREYTSFLFSLSLSLDDVVATTARRMQKTDFAALWNSIQGARRMGADYSPNLSSFNALLHGMDRQAEKLNISALQIVHDEQQEFQTLFTKVWDVASHAPIGTFQFPNGNLLRFPTERLKSITFARSEDHVGIQVADILAAAARVAIEDYIGRSDGRSAPYLEALTELLRSPLAGGIFPFVIGGESWQVDVLSLLLARRRK